MSEQNNPATEEQDESNFETFLKTASVHSAKMVLQLIEVL